MSTDRIVDEIHRQRAKEVKRLNYDFASYCRHLREQQGNVPARMVSAPRKPSKRETRPRPPSPTLSRSLHEATTLVLA